MASNAKHDARRLQMRRIPFARTFQMWRDGLSHVLSRPGNSSVGRKRHSINVMTSCGGPNSGITQILIRSISDSHPDDHITFWFFHLNVAQAILNRLERFCEGLPNLTLRQVRVPPSDKLAELRTLGGKPDCERFLWFVAHQYLPENLDRIIYIDALDAMVVDDLSPFLHEDIGDRLVLACHEFMSWRQHSIIKTGPAREAARQGADPKMLKRVAMGLINSGVMVLNLSRFRQDGLTLDRYVETARWAADQGLSFGDQGLFSLTHGSDFAPAHDRFNYRFGFQGAQRVKAPPAVVHFAGHIPKPFAFRLSEEQEERVRTAARRQGGVLQLGKTHRIAPSFLPHYRRWWAFSERTLVHQRIAPLAEDSTLKLLDRLGLQLEDAHGE